MPPRKPAAPRLNPFVRRLVHLLESTGKTQKEVAQDLGYEKSNIITMFKQGTTRVPLDKVPALAFSLGADPAGLVRLWFQTHEPEALTVIDRDLEIPITENEKTWVMGLREAYENDVPAYDDDARAAIRLQALKHKLERRPAE